MHGAEARSAGVPGVQGEVTDCEGRLRIGGAFIVFDVSLGRTIGVEGETRGDGLQLFADREGGRSGLRRWHAHG